MLQLKHLELIEKLTGVKSWEVRPVKFGYSVTYSTASTYNLAAEMIPENVGLLVARVQCFCTQIDNTQSDYLFPRSFPEGVAWWDIARTAGGTAITNFTATSAPGQLPLDCDELLLFPPNWVANLMFTAAAAAPSAGTWKIRTTCFGYFIPPQAYEALGGSGDWINVQQ